MICAKIYRMWPQQSDTANTAPSVKDSILNWSDSLNDGVVYYQEILPKGEAKLDVLLLHGHRFSSANWVELNTLNILALEGYRAIALDLPGYGKSSYKLDSTDAASRIKFLQQFIEKKDIKSPVIVSASMSGIYSLAYIAAHKTSVKGFVAIAVAGTDKVPQKSYLDFPLTLIVRGSKDQSLGITSTETLSKNIQDHLVEVISDAGHACYLDKPEKFHSILLAFLKKCHENSQSRH